MTDQRAALIAEIDSVLRDMNVEVKKLRVQLDDAKASAGLDAKQIKRAGAALNPSLSQDPEDMPVRAASGPTLVQRLIIEALNAETLAERPCDVEPYFSMILAIARTCRAAADRIEALERDIAIYAHDCERAEADNKRLAERAQKYRDDWERTKAERDALREVVAKKGI